ncbi:MAG: tritrans,polycis-undecaprenyl-diphosphate synthase [Halobacteriales archaeon]|jgi:tritrans,polycis-undecaprenyl-diphosphate synthase [geranylgeranyl-diphosphate specific]
MHSWFRDAGLAAYERLLEREIGEGPTHVAIIQDGNRRYAREQGGEANEGHEAGAETTEQVLQWCQEYGIEELTLYAFSTENFNRPDEEREHLFDLLAEKLRSFADADQIHEEEVSIQAIGRTERLPERVRDAIQYAEDRTVEYDRFVLNVAVAYGGRAELLEATRTVVEEAGKGDVDPAAVNAELIEDRLYDRPVRDVDLIIRTGGDERTSNFLPWHANGNEAAVYFCAPYWPEFNKIDFLRGIRTYEYREESWRRTRAQRGLALLRELGGVELGEATRIVERFWDSLPTPEREAYDVDDVTGDPSSD